MNTDYKKKLDLLTRPIWNATDIKEYFGVSETTAYRIRKRVIDECNGLTDYGAKYVKRDAVFRLYNTTAENEISKIRLLVGEQNEQKEL